MSADGVLGTLFVVTEILLIGLTPALLSIGIVGWSAAAFRGAGGQRVAVVGLCVNLLLAVIWGVLFAPVFLSPSLMWPRWVLAMAPARGWAFYFTWVVAIVADVVLRQRFRVSGPSAEVVIPAAGG